MCACACACVCVCVRAYVRACVRVHVHVHVQVDVQVVRKLDTDRQAHTNANNSLISSASLCPCCVAAVLQFAPIV